MYYVDENIKNCFRINGGETRYGYHRYDMNENPEGLPEDFVKTVLGSITPEFLSIYPEIDGFCNKYANFVGVNPENVVPVNGSDMAIRYLLETFCEKGKEVVTVTPSFEMYAVNCSILGLKHKPVAYDSELNISISDIISAIGRNTDVVVLVNPNNPVGNVYSDAEIEEIVDQAHKNNAIVIIDEAYHYFYKKTSIDLINRYDNVAVIRTFSKLFSLAACRLGVIIGDERLIGFVKNNRLSFDTNAIALLFGEKILDTPQLVNTLIDSVNEGKKYLVDMLTNKGYEIRVGEGNFIFVVPHVDSYELAEKLKNRHRVLVKTYKYDVLKRYIRVSIGSKNAMELFVDAFFMEDSE